MKPTLPEGIMLDAPISLLIHEVEIQSISGGMAQKSSTHIVKSSPLLERYAGSTDDSFAPKGVVDRKFEDSAATNDVQFFILKSVKSNQS